jgi:hypothetical protein
MSTNIAGDANEWLQRIADHCVVVEILCANQGLERVHDDEDRALALGCAFELRDSVGGAWTNDEL